MIERTAPTHCPHCGSTEHLHSAPEWEARSLDSCDRDNMATLAEYQCHSDTCEGRSFWVGLGVPSVRARCTITIEIADPASLEIEAKIMMAIQSLRMELAGPPLEVLPEGAVMFAIVNTPEHLYRLTHFEPSDGNGVPS